MANYLGRFLGSQTISFEVRRRDLDAGRIVEIEVSAHSRPPVVMERDGTVGSGSEQESLFRSGDVLTRSGTRATLARRPDFDRRIAAAEARGEQRAYELMRRIADRPAGFEAVLRPPDTPTARLVAAAQTYAGDPAKLIRPGIRGCS